MGYKKYLLIILLCCPALLAQAQKKQHYSKARADDLTDSLINAGNWKEVIVKSEVYIAHGIDYTGLRLKAGFAQFMMGNYAAATENYDKVLQRDPNNQTALYYLYLCYKYQNNETLAGAQLAKLDSTSLKLLQVNRTGLVSVGLESSYKIANTTYRGNASYTQADLSIRIAGKLQVYNAVSYFDQKIYSYGSRKWQMNDDRQKENFLKLSYALLDHFTLMGGWHYLHTQYLTTNYNGNLFIGGINYSVPYINLQTDVDAGQVITDRIKQYNGQVMVEPLGNLNLYFVSGVSYLNRSTTNNFVFSEMAGFKAAKDVWLETSATFGNLNDYVEAGGLYIYDAFDDTKLKLGETAYLQLSQRLMLNLNYTYEKKQDNVEKFNYNQNSIAARISWTF
jgi:tetratricopeptide (TPR) repeat protein